MEIKRRMTYNHERAAAKHRRTRRANSINAGSDRCYEKRFQLTDTKLTKKRLHKANRRNLEIASTQYYKTQYRLGTICFIQT